MTAFMFILSLYLSFRFTTFPVACAKTELPIDCSCNLKFNSFSIGVNYSNYSYDGSSGVVLLLEQAPHALRRAMDLCQFLVCLHHLINHSRSRLTFSYCCMLPVYDMILLSFYRLIYDCLYMFYMFQMVVMDESEKSDAVMMAKERTGIVIKNDDIERIEKAKIAMLIKNGDIEKIEKVKTAMLIKNEDIVANNLIKVALQSICLRYQTIK